MGALADSAGRRTAMMLAGQSAVTYRWNNAKRLTQIAQGSRTDLGNLTYKGSRINRRL